jgi:hypothetical protein
MGLSGLSSGLLSCPFLVDLWPPKPSYASRDRRISRKMLAHLLEIVDTGSNSIMAEDQCFDSGPPTFDCLAEFAEIDTAVMQIFDELRLVVFEFLPEDHHDVVCGGRVTRRRRDRHLRIGHWSSSGFLLMGCDAARRRDAIRKHISAYQARASPLDCGVGRRSSQTSRKITSTNAETRPTKQRRRFFCSTRTLRREWKRFNSSGTEPTRLNWT